MSLPDGGKSVLPEVLDANENYVTGFGELGKLTIPPARR